MSLIKKLEFGDLILDFHDQPNKEMLDQFNAVSKEMNAKDGEESKGLNLRKSGDVWHMDFYGEISGRKAWFMPEETITDKDFSEALAQTGEDNLIIHMNSIGGSITVGSVMANLLQERKGHSEIWIEGQCASAATLLLLASDKNLIGSIGMPSIMMHLPSMVILQRVALNQIDDLRQSLLDTKGRFIELVDDISDQFAKMTGKQKKSIRKWHYDGKDFSAKEAIANKLVSGYIPKTQMVAEPEPEATQEQPQQELPVKESTITEENDKRMVADSDYLQFLFDTDFNGNLAGDIANV